MNGERLFTKTEYFHPFPDACEVFANRVDEHSKYLLPLASVDLARLSPEWSGRIHFVSPMEPYEGVVGSGTDIFHNYLCRENWVGYRIVDGKYELATDFRFFQKAFYEDDQPSSNTLETSYDQLVSHYENVQAGFALQHDHFLKHGFLHHAWAKKGIFGGFKEADRVDMVEELGGVSLDGNWSNMENFPIISPGFWVDEDAESRRRACPQTEDRREFAYIGSTPINHYIAAHPELTSILGGSLLLFYDPVSKVALTTFDWS